ncbi:MAG: 3-isopropylmalate dehydratase [Candidatus Omnitrophota bacterium]|nr:3-isopropylmalate dehydratase [Candidatus Omnitrophota bacterium]
MLRGDALKLPFDDDINTDYIISGRYKFHIQDPVELSRHIFEDIDNDFYNRVKKGSFLVAGKNFGMGSSREQAPLALKAAGISAIIAKSFARIFYRNSFNIGLALVECDTSNIEQGDQLVVDLDQGLLKDITKNIEIKISVLPPTMKRLLEDGGAIEHFKKYGGFEFGP